VLPSGELASSLILVNRLHYVKNTTMMSSTKPEIHNVLHCSQKRTKTATCNIQNISRNLDVRFLRYAFVQRDRQTYRHADQNTSHSYQGRSSNSRRRLTSKPNSAVDHDSNPNLNSNVIPWERTTTAILELRRLSLVCAQDPHCRQNRSDLAVRRP